MITVFSFSEQRGFDQTSDLEVLKELARKKDSLFWVDIERPTTEETELLDTLFNFHPLAIEDCILPRNDPKVEDYGQYLFLIVHGVLPESSERDFRTTELDVFLSTHYLLTYHKARISGIDILKERIFKNPKSVMKEPDFILQAILDEVVDQYFPVMQQMDRRVQELENGLFDARQRDLLNEILRLKRNLMRLKVVTAQQKEMITHLVQSGFEEIRSSAIPYFRNVNDHLGRITDLAETYRDTLNNLTQAHLSITSNKLSEVMKVLTIFAAIILPLTLISGIYGMNFRWMPELDWKFGYPLVLGGMGAIAAGLLLFFRKRKWI